MADVLANNYKEAGDLLVWLDMDSDTAVVYKYTCPVDTHKVLAPSRLGYKDDMTTHVGSGEMLCPVHDVAMGDGTKVSIT